MKKSIPILLFIVFVLSSCFSPWNGDDAELTIALGNSDPSRNLVNTAGGEQNSFAYEVTLTGAGRTVRQVFMPMAPLTLKVFPGKYSIEVRALEASGFKLRGLGETPAPVEIRVGKNVVPLTMTSATVVTRWGNSSTVGSLCYEVTQGNSRENRPEIFVLKKGGGVNDWDISNLNSILISRPITLIAEDTVEIGRTTHAANFFMINNGGKLTLKCKPGRSLVLNGDRSMGVSAALIQVVPGGTLEMNDGVTLKNNNVPTAPFSGGGVNVAGGTFIMNGGTISNNSAGTSANNNGGGVNVDGGTFIMNGGTITGNEAPAGGAAGGGVFVTGGGTFYMKGGAITNNTANGGGGVYIDGTVSLTPTFFTLSGGTITGNNAILSGCGVYVQNNGHFYIVSPATEGSIHGNNGFPPNQDVSISSGSTITIHGVLHNGPYLW